MKKILIITVLAVVIGLVWWGCENTTNPIEPITNAQPAMAKQIDDDQFEISAARGGTGKVDICHLDDEGNYITINVSVKALPAHLAHGDYEPHCGFLGTFEVHYYPSYGGDIPHTMTITAFDLLAGTFSGTGGPDTAPYDYDVVGTIVGDVVTLDIDYGDDDPIVCGRYTLQAVFTINEDCSFNSGTWSANSTNGGGVCYSESGTMQVTTDATWVTCD